ncbi:acyltransferase [Serratia marcescens]|nr:acyltransferase [Serratia marcescens]
MSKLLVGQILERKNNNFDLVRLLATLSVIVYHSLALNPQWGLVDPIKIFFGYITTGGLAVKIFFFLSGLLVTNSLLSRKSVLQFIVARSFRILPGLALVVTFTAFVIGPTFTTMPVSDYFKSGQLYEYVYRNILLDTQFYLPGVFEGNSYGVNGSLWTIHYEMLAYFTLGLLYLIKIVSLRWLSTLLCFIVIIEPITPFKGVLFASADNNAIYLLAPCFALGSLLAINKNSYRSNMYVPCFLFAAQFIFIDENTRSLLLCTSLCLICLHISSLKMIVGVRIRNDISYGVYLWGFPIQQAISQNLELNPASNIALSIMLSVSIAILSWFLVEKPAMNFARKISDKKPIIPSTKSIHK